MNSKYRARIATLVLALVAGGVAVFIAVRSRDANSVAPESSTSESSAAKEFIEHAEAEVATAVVVDPLREVRATTARFRGRIVYESSHEPVPWCGVAVRAPGEDGELLLTGDEGEATTTDENGRFATALEYPAGPLDVVIWDQPPFRGSWDGALSIKHKPASSGEVEIPVRAWPTIVIDGGMPEGRDPHTWMYVLDDCRHYSPACVTSSGVLFWRNRFIPGVGDLNDLKRHDAPWWLVIDDTQSGMSSTIALGRVAGVIHIAPHWEKLGALVITLRTGANPPAPCQLSLRLRPVLTCMDDSPRFVHSMMPSARLENLRPGSFVLDVSSEFCGHNQVPVTIRSGETTQVEVHLSGERPAGSIRGVIVPESGTHAKNDRLYLQLKSADNGRILADYVPVEWTDENGVAIGRFEIRDLPSRVYELALTNPAFATRPATPLDVQPGDEIRLTLLDRAPKVDIGFEVFDKQTGDALQEFAVLGAWGFRDEYHARPRTVVFKDVAEDSLITWRIAVGGYAYSKGTLASASRSWTVDGKRRWVRVELEHGTRVDLLVLADDGNGSNGTPLVNAAVLINDREVGRTDKRGKFETLFPSKVESIDVTYLNWRYSSWSGSRDNRIGYFNSGGEIPFILGPP